MNCFSFQLSGVMVRPKFLLLAETSLTSSTEERPGVHFPLWTSMHYSSNPAFDSWKFTAMLRTTQSLQVGYFTKMPTQPLFSPLRSHRLLHEVSSSGCWCKLMAATLEVIVPPRVVIWRWFIGVFREAVKVARIDWRGDLNRRSNNKTPLKPADRPKQILLNQMTLRVYTEVTTLQGWREKSTEKLEVTMGRTCLKLQELFTTHLTLCQFEYV